MVDLKEAKSVRTNIVCFQEPYVGGNIFSRPAFDIRWGTVWKMKEIRISIGIAVSRRGQLIVEARMNIIDYIYIMAQDLWELEIPGGKKKRRTRIVNTYDNNLHSDQVW